MTAGSLRTAISERDRSRAKALPRMVRLPLCAVWFVAPFSATSIGVRDLKAFDLFALLALLAVSGTVGTRQRTALYLPRPSRRLLVGIAVLCTGLTLGGVRGQVDAPTLIRVAAYGLAAALPVVLLLRARVGADLLRDLATSFVGGVVASVVAAWLGEVRPGTGRWEGLTTHPNQLGMTCAMALVLLPVAFTRSTWRRAVFWPSVLALCAGLLYSGSRSALISAIVGIGLMSLNWSIQRGRRAVLLTVAVIAAGLLVSAVTLDLGDDSNAVARLTTGEVGRSDERREALLDSGLEALTAGNVAFGAGGDFLERAPHNVVLELLVTGGVLALGGFVLAFGPAVTRALSGTVRRARPADSYRYACAVTVFVVAVCFNNAVWARFAWAILALFVVSLTVERDNLLQPQGPDASG